MEFPPRRTGFIYVIFWVANEKATPFYVGETDRLSARMQDYIQASFKASTDFKVGEAIKYLQQRNYSIAVKCKPAGPNKVDRMDEEREVVRRLHIEGFQLLNDLRGYNYRTANEEKERIAIQMFCENLVAVRRAASAE